MAFSGKELSTEGKNVEKMLISVKDQNKDLIERMKVIANLLKMIPALNESDKKILDNQYEVSAFFEKWSNKFNEIHQKPPTPAVYLVVHEYFESLKSPEKKAEITKPTHPAEVQKILDLFKDLKTLQHSIEELKKEKKYKDAMDIIPNINKKVIEILKLSDDLKEKQKTILEEQEHLSQFKEEWHKKLRSFAEKKDYPNREDILDFFRYKKDKREKEATKLPGIEDKEAELKEKIEARQAKTEMIRAEIIKSKKSSATDELKKQASSDELLALDGLFQVYGICKESLCIAVKVMVLTADRKAASEKFGIETKEVDEIVNRATQYLKGYTREKTESYAPLAKLGLEFAEAKGSLYPLTKLDNNTDEIILGTLNLKRGNTLQYESIDTLEKHKEFYATNVSKFNGKSLDQFETLCLHGTDAITDLGTENIVRKGM